MIPPRRPRSGWLDGGHLTLDVVVALVDGELADGPTQRALAHVEHCLTCAAEVTAQRQARRRLRGAGTPGVPTSLLSTLRAIPDSADLPAVPGTLAVDAEGRFVVRDASREPHDQEHGTPSDDGDHAGSSPGSPLGPPPAGTDGPLDTEPGSGTARLSRRARRRLAVGIPAAVVSGVAFGALAVTPGTPAPAPTAATPRPVVVPRGSTSPADLGAQLSLRDDESSAGRPGEPTQPGLPGPGER